MKIKYDTTEPLSCKDILNDFMSSEHRTMQLDFDTFEERERAYEAYRKCRTRYKYEINFTRPTDTQLCIKKIEIEERNRDPEYDAWLQQKRKHSSRYNSNVKKFKETYKGDAMSVDSYRERMIQAFFNAGRGDLVSLVVQPYEKEFEHLEWLLKHVNKDSCLNAFEDSEDM